jgi:hypothetical protein
MEPSSSAISPDLAGNGVGKEEGKKDPDGENNNYAAESGSGTSKDITSDKEESKLKDCDAEENIAGKESTDGDNKSETKEEDEKKKPVDDQKPNDFSAGPVVSSTKKTRPPYKYDPNKVVLRFLFANRDGLTVTVECKPADTVGEVKAQLLSVWPDGELLISLKSGSRMRCTKPVVYFGKIVADFWPLYDFFDVIFKQLCCLFQPVSILISLPPPHHPLFLSLASLRRPA